LQAHQGKAFRDSVQAYLASLNYSVAVEEGKFGSRNIVIGDPKTANYLVTAHYDTPARLPFPNFITPCSFAPFVLYQLFTLIVIFTGAVLLDLFFSLLLSGVSFGGLPGGAYILIICLLMLIGPANSNNANDNTSGVVTVLEIARTRPENQRHKVCFVLFDLEEAGLLGSESYYKKHKQEVQNQLVLNLDCVGDGDHIMLFPGKKVRSNEPLCAALRRLTGEYGNKTVSLREKGFSYNPSDHANFPLGTGIIALHTKKGVGPWLGRIHTKKDTVLDETNVNLLRAALTSLIMAYDKL
jgi:hypothetical protein